jgi:hypothetical protein
MVISMIQDVSHIIAGTVILKLKTNKDTCMVKQHTSSARRGKWRFCCQQSISRGCMSYMGMGKSIGSMLFKQKISTESNIGINKIYRTEGREQKNSLPVGSL